MELAFLGHQSWMVSHNVSSILIDPILKDGFGAEDTNRIEIFPPRSIDFERMPKPDVVILTHEHSDHFNISSLNVLSRDTEIIVGLMMIESVVECIESLGFRVTRKAPNQAFRVGDIEVTLYSAAPETVLWESRVYQIYIHPVDNVKESAFIAVDALVSKRFKEDILTGVKAVPQVVALSNNAQVTPKGVFGSLDNMLLDSDEGKTGLIGLNILHELLILYLQGMPHIKNILICGGGFMKGYENLGAFPFSDQKKLAQSAQLLSRGVKVFGPYPGNSYTFIDGILHENTVSWIKLKQERLQELLTQQSNFVASKKVVEITSICGDFISDTEAKNADKAIIEELSILALPLMLSKIGRHAVEISYYLGNKLGSKRILFRFLNFDRTCRYQWVLDVNKAKFVEDTTPESEILRTFPFGIECFVKDFYQMLQGEIQIWDMAGVAMRSWYVSEKLESPVGFLYCYYGEQLQNQRTKNFYNKYMRSVNIADISFSGERLR